MESTKNNQQENLKDLNEKFNHLTLFKKVPVDKIFQNQYGNDYQVLVDDNITYSTIMNQTNLSGNNNKFYIIQVLQNMKIADNYYLWTRWGRVGSEGQSNNKGPITKQIAIQDHNKKLNDKLGVGYSIVQINYYEHIKQVSFKKKEIDQKIEYEQSKLDKRVKDLIKLIFDEKMMNDQLKQIGYDSKKMPLRKLAKSIIIQGYQILKKLMDQIKGQNKKNIIEQLSSQFYTLIPHDFGFQKMQNFILDTELKIKQKLQMLQSLQDIQIFTKLVDQEKFAPYNQLDLYYSILNTNIQPLDKQSNQFKVLESYVKNTHGKTHTFYHLQIQEIFKITKQNQQQRFPNHIHNKMLLWHSSRLSNFVGIISQGLRIAPPQAPVSGYIFGKGVYFTDIVTKSANYCFTNPSNNTGLMLLCQVALGDMNEKYYADYYANLLPLGKMSTKGVGKNAPSSIQQLEDVIVPNGLVKETGIANTSLLYNQFIVYNVNQIKMRYLFRMKFIYK